MERERESVDGTRLVALAGFEEAYGDTWNVGYGSRTVIELFGAWEFEIDKSGDEAQLSRDNALITEL
ncbi:hypothetical protein Scep_000595 [Stephania cephalantha]|uniref:Uncharacterized protein n=1 Tax=Stephania cephalantha TaxID=152367 RepID=A0AAP0LAJ0_9MAGN